MSTIKNESTNIENPAIRDQPSALWHNRDYLLLLGGQSVSTVGTQVSLLAFPLLVLALTGSPIQAGIIGALRAFPYLIFSLPAGALIDRWNRKRVMILCDTVRALSLASIPLALALGHLTLIQLYLVSLIEGTLFVFFNIAQVACLPHVVSKEQLPAAISQDIATNSIAFLLGPSFGGILYSLGRIVPFLTDAISYVVSVISLLFIKTEFQAQREVPPLKLWVEIREGLVWVWHQHLIRFIALLAFAVQFAIVGTTLIIIVLAQHQHASPFTIGLILAADGLGSIVGALVGPFIQKRFSFGQVMVGTSWFVALLWPLYAIAPNAVLLGGITAAIFMTLSIFDVTQFSYRLALIPDKLQGRVNSVFRLIAFTGGPLGLVLTGILLQVIGPILTVVIFGGWLIMAAGVTTLNPYVRHARPLSEVRVDV